jgi:hypothetical protein
MRKFTFSGFLLCIISAAALQSCKNDSYLMAPPAVPDQSFVEEFDTVQTAFNRGWRFINKSENIGVSNWTQGSISGTLTAYSSKGTNAGFITTDYQSTAAAAAVISNWAVSPAIMMQNGDKIVFYTRAQLYALTGGDSTDYANRLEVRLNTRNDGTDVGNGGDPGHFEDVLLDINPTYLEHHVSPALYDPRAYPARWTRFEATVVGLNKPTRGRFAFRYFVEDGGGNGRGSEVGIDSVAYIGKH